MPGGRPPKPRRISEIDGNPGKRRLRTEPKAPGGVPSPPTWLSSKAKFFYRELAGVLADMGLVTMADRRSLEILADAYAEFRYNTEYCRTHGDTVEVETKNGTSVQVRPERTLAEMHRKTYIRMLSEFGLSPTARARLGVDVAKGEGDEVDAWLKRTRQPQQVGGERDGKKRTSF